MRRLSILILSLLFFSPSFASPSFWQEVALENLRFEGKRDIHPKAYRVFQLQEVALKQLVQKAQTKIVSFSIPSPTGQMLILNWENAQIMSAGLQVKYPNILAIKGDGGLKSFLWGRAEFTSSGFHAQIHTRHGTFFIEPLSDDPTGNLYQTYYRKDYSTAQHQPMSCLLGGEPYELPEDDFHPEDEAPAWRTHGLVLKTYRLALACTFEYAMYVGGPTPSKTSVLSAMVTTVNRVSGLYESELAVRLQLIPTTDTFIYLTNPDPYSNSNGATMLGENQLNMSNTLADSAYDIGHVFSTGGGGIASKSSVCSNNSKARGVTGSSNPIGDPFDIDYVAHEMGHQFGADHTFNASSGSCSGNGVSLRAYEPGSASTIMGYAGICSGNNLQAHSDAYFHAISLQQITGFINNSNSGGSCPAQITLNNTIPQIAPFAQTYFIPSLTPFEFDLPPAIDTDYTSLTYVWEEWDRGDFGANWSQTRFGPIFRSFNPDTNNFRTFPVLSKLLNNQFNYLGEKLPDTNRKLNFRLTVRDMKNGVGSHNFPNDTLRLDVQHSGEAFEVIFPTTASIKIPVNNQIAVTWQLAGTDLAPINCQQVSILLSTDGGNTFPIILKASTPNDGSDTVTIPNIPLSNTARIKIKSIGNVFFAMSKNNFQLLDSTQSVSGILLAKPTWAVYPNPSNAIIKIELPKLKQAAAITFYNSIGQVVLQKVEKKSFQIDIATWPAGIYFVRLQEADGQRHVKQFSVL